VGERSERLELVDVVAPAKHCDWRALGVLQHQGRRRRVLLRHGDPGRHRRDRTREHQFSELEHLVRWVPNGQAGYRSQG
jgi:hypothetical protein